jgi:hypothetical protein
MKSDHSTPPHRRLAVAHSRAVRQSIHVRRRSGCPQFANLADMIGRARRASSGPIRTKGFSS